MEAAILIFTWWLLGLTGILAFNNDRKRSPGWVLFAMIGGLLLGPLLWLAILIARVCDRREKEG